MDHPSPRVRLGAALLVALLALGVFLTRVLLADPTGETAGDLKVVLVGARMLHDGVDIFAQHPVVVDRLSGAYSTGHYPLPAYLVVGPLAWLAPAVGGGIFVFAATFWAAWLLAGRGLSHLLIFASFPAVKAWGLAQWSPLMLVAALSPWAAGLALCKPNLGLAVLAGFPSRRAVLSCLGVLGVSLAVRPDWIGAWLQNGIPDIHGVHVSTNPDIRSLVYEIPVLALPLGPLLLCSALGWRAPAGRLLLVQSLVPQRLSFYDQLPLGLAATSPRQRVAWVAATWAGAALYGLGGEPMRPQAVLLGVMLPALACLLVSGSSALDQTQGDPAPVGLDPQDRDLEHLAGAQDLAPGDLADVQQAILLHPEVHEGPEVDDVPDGSV